MAVGRGRVSWELLAVSRVVCLSDAVKHGLAAVVSSGRAQPLMPRSKCVVLIDLAHRWLSRLQSREHLQRLGE